MALNLMRGVSVHPKPPPGPSRPPPPIAVYLMIPKHKHLLKLHNYYYYYYNCSPISSYHNRPTAQSRSPPQGTETTGVEEEEEEEKPPTNYSGSSSSARTQLEFLEQLTSNSPSNGYESDHGSSRKLTIRDQLSQLVGERDDDDDDGDFSIQLGKKNLKKVSPKFLTISQKRNIKRQAYMDEVSQRNDTVFFATIGAFVILPPLIILGIAIITGYVQLFP